jgi:beta-glucosidase
MSLDGEPFQSDPSDVGGIFKTLRLEKGKRYSISISQISPAGTIATKLIWKRISETPVQDAVKAAEAADTVVAVVGITADLESEESPVSLPGFSRGDRTTLALPEDQQKLLEALKTTGKKLVVVSMSGSAIDLGWAQENADAIIHAWYPGQEGGTALGNILSGKVNPSGRLPVTFYRDLAQLPPFDSYAMEGRTYRYFTGSPLYPFGYGLSYTKFSYGPVSIEPVDGSASKGIRVSVTITNVGARDGAEAAQLYLKFPADPGAPQVALRGLERIHLRKGEARRVTFTLSPREIGTVSLTGSHRVLAGTYQVSVGGGQPAYAETSNGTFTVAREAPLPD